MIAEDEALVIEILTKANDSIVIRRSTGIKL